jgi:hypothetical protein
LSLRVCTFCFHSQSTFQHLCSLFLLLILRRGVRAVAVDEPVLDANGEKGKDVGMLESARSLSSNRIRRRLPLLIRPSVSLQRQSRSVILLTNGVDVVRHTHHCLDLPVAVSVCSRHPCCLAWRKCLSKLSEGKVSPGMRISACFYVAGQVSGVP